MRGRHDDCDGASGLGARCCVHRGRAHLPSLLLATARNRKSALQLDVPSAPSLSAAASSHATGTSSVCKKEPSWARRQSHCLVHVQRTLSHSHSSASGADWRTPAADAGLRNEQARKSLSNRLAPWRLCARMPCVICGRVYYLVPLFW